MACNASELLEEGKCYQCLTEKQMAIVELQLLCAIFNSGGGGGGGGTQQVYQGLVPPTPDDPTKPAVFYINGGGTQLQWDVPSQTWV